MVAEAAEGRAVLLFGYTAQVKVPLWEGQESCPGVALCRLGVPVCTGDTPSANTAAAL